MSKSKLYTSLALILFFVFIFAIKAFLGFNSPQYNRQDGTCLYWTEAAFQYGYAERIASGLPLPEMDIRAQYPEGIRPGTDLTVFTEYLAGYSYRYIFNPVLKVPFHTFSIWYIAFISTLPVFVIFLCGRLLFKNDSAAWIAALLYGLSPFTFMRVVGNFGRENLSLTFIFLSSLGIFLALGDSGNTAGRRGRYYAGIIIAAVGGILALSSWHMSRSVLEVQVLILFIMVMTGVTDRAGQKAIALYIIALVPFAFLLPVLRSRMYFISPAMILGYAIIADLPLRRIVTKTAFRRIGIAALSAAACVIVQLNSQSDSHVFQVIKDKLRLFLVKPEDPGRLSFESRAMWIEAFNSPGWYELLYYFPLILPLFIISIYLLVRDLKREEKPDRARVYMLLNLMVFTFLFLLIFRIHVFFIFWLILFLGGCFHFGFTDKKVLKYAVYSLIIMQLILSSYQAFTVKTSNPLRQGIARITDKEQAEFVNYHQNNLDLISWIKEKTNEDDVFAGSIGLTPVIYTYADRPIVLHSKFENDPVRRKFRESLEALFENPAKLSEFLRKYKIDYYVYQANFLLDSSTESSRYIAGCREILSDMPVYLLHFRPYELDSVELVYQNPTYRVFRVMTSDDQRYLNPPLGYEPVFDRRFFEINDKERYDDGLTAPALMKINELYIAYAAAVDDLGSGNIARAETVLREIATAVPRFYRAWLRLGEINMALEKFDIALGCYNNVLKGYPCHPEALKYITEIQLNGSVPGTDSRN